MVVAIEGLRFVSAIIDFRSCSFVILVIVVGRGGGGGGVMFISLDISRHDPRNHDVLHVSCIPASSAGFLL